VLPLALLVAAVPVAGVPAPASAAGEIAEDRTYRTEVTGIQVVDWRGRSSWPLDDLAGWSTQDGSQTLGWRTTRTGRLAATRYLRRRLGGTVLPPMALDGTTRAVRLRGTVRRTSAVRRRDPRPVCEGGALDPECRVLPVPRSVAQSCGRRALPVRVHLGVSGARNEDLLVTTSAHPDRRYATCGPREVMALRPPTVGTGRSPDGDLDVAFPDVARRLARLSRGRTLRLRSHVRLGCPWPSIRPGVVDACTTTDVSVELTRLR
jgi:hypothetical protein